MTSLTNPAIMTSLTNPATMTSILGIYQSVRSLHGIGAKMETSLGDRGITFVPELVTYFRDNLAGSTKKLVLWIRDKEHGLNVNLSDEYCEIIASQLRNYKLPYNGQSN